MRLSLLKIALFALSVIIYEIITYELPNVQDSNSHVKDVDNLDESQLADEPCQNTSPTYVKIGASRFSRLFVVHSHTFRDRETDGRTHVLPARIYRSTLLDRCNKKGQHRSCHTTKCNILNKWLKTKKIYTGHSYFHFHHQTPQT